MKRMLSLCAAALCLTLTLTPTALAADFEPAVPNAKVCYPTAIVRSDDGTELKKIYDLSPEDDPAGIPRSDFRQDGFHYTLTDLLKQELPENESRQHTEHISVESAKKDMESVLALLPQEREFITDDGLMGTLTLRLDTVQVEPSGYGSSTREITTKRSYPNLAEQDTQYLPKTITENGKTLTLTDIQWQTDNTANLDGYAVADRYNAMLHAQRIEREPHIAAGFAAELAYHRQVALIRADHHAAAEEVENRTLGWLFIFSNDQAGKAVHCNCFIIRLTVGGRKNAAVPVLLFDFLSQCILRQGKRLFRAGELIRRAQDGCNNAHT